MRSLKRVMYIHESLLNGQKLQCYELIELYGTDEFWSDYRDYLNEYGLSTLHFIDMTIAYFYWENQE